ncbi:hypothetical protein RIF29_21707 [Crotalaria pallida]|uniref:SET domain-containing protein n=1 Tax=Crotalaria pallida TaxID=3830 RepID=A0AAN9F7U8_CROPI
MKSKGFEWSDALEFVDTPEEGVSVRALRDLEEDDVVAKMPKEACLTIKNSGACGMIENAGLEGHLGLAFAIMYEQSLGEDSPWAGYLQFLPQQECLPLVWTLDEVNEFLGGTVLHQDVHELKARMYADWKESILPLLDLAPTKLNPKFFGIEQYLAARTLIASRSFEIDDYHGSGMVPLADLFNHKTAAENVHFTAIPSKDESDGNISDEIEGDPAVLEMVMYKDVRCGAEVFNTYGIVGNAELLHRYGFTEQDNSYDFANIDLELVLKWCSSLFSDRHSRARVSLWRRLGYSPCGSENNEYLKISFAGEPQIELLILLYIMLLPDKEYHDLDLSVSTTGKRDESSETTLLDDKIFPDKASDMSKKQLLLTKEVCDALLSLADMRESLYGSKSVEDDIEAFERCSLAREKKMYHSLVLRIGERKILQKLRKFVSQPFKNH